MITKNLHEKCGELFATYPLAVSDHCSIVLMAADGQQAKFFILNHASGKDRYWLHPWRAEGDFEIDAKTWDVPAWVTDVLAHGVPLPRHGSLFGWKTGNDITTLVAAYSQYEPEHPEPSFSVMPLASLPKSQWPPFISEHFFGPWFWDHYRAGRIVSLAGLVAASRATVFWVVPEGALGGCVAVEHDVKGTVGTLPRGVYAYFKDLPLPPLDELLAFPGNADLAPRFKRMAEVSR
jgi:hypothetical protein